MRGQDRVFSFQLHQTSSLPCSDGLLSEEELRAIRDHPLDNALDTFIEPLRNVDSSPSSEGVHDRSEQLRDLLSGLFHTLSGARAAWKLHSRTRGRDLSSELFDISKHVRNGDFAYDHCRPLVKLVIQKAADVEIWSAVFDLVAKISRTTPLPPVARNLWTKRAVQDQFWVVTRQRADS
ncbi:hypothetical protein VTN31DRAFT_264 [Thermomyces dupontii]|uniref:uncharacterized protein n=1 Tax=Talaromyces thermophilus TaxID=28565 RepID=UPI003741EE99